MGIVGVWVVLVMGVAGCWVWDFGGLPGCGVCMWIVLRVTLVGVYCHRCVVFLGVGCL